MRSARGGQIVTALAAAAVLAFALLGDDEYTQHLLMWTALNAVLAVGLRFMLLVGETNIGTGAFYGMGAYIGAICTTKWGVPFPLTLLAGGVLAIVVSTGARPRDSGWTMLRSPMSYERISSA